MIRVVPGPEELATEACAIFARAAEAAIGARGIFSASLCGGETPRGAYELIARSPETRRLPWEKIHFFWSDERPVPPDDIASNYRMAFESMLRKLPVPRANVHRIRAELRDPHLAAAHYEELLKRFFGLGGAGSSGPDLTFLGVGSNGHTASLFPDGRVDGRAGRWVIAPFIKSLGSYRITCTIELLNLSREVVFVVGGEAKAEILRRILENPAAEAMPLPASLVRPASGKLLWLLDEAAASRLSTATILQAA